MRVKVWLRERDRVRERRKGWDEGYEKGIGLGIGDKVGLGDRVRARKEDVGVC